MKQIQPFQKHWLQLTSIVVCRLNIGSDNGLGPDGTKPLSEFIITYGQ